ncbi:MAG: phosphoribosyl transferase [Candidatus Levybacteria bacterium RIFCSPLOWO2_01_FULL_39_24]|nr:MAG: phosphoribosyl transferase [Candidatus Levybacteria bacterium RIFCSPHIGHO2_01_FULL_40_16]OGH28126.1 MAG: phosphoribosyl transferase [Candidatus Levybacteria bacterium RIFCSPHIGHO2_12_FULL_39_9]OGH46685.1 MAG: phosphoribosyl transferase [Candidatus Levybacteria bacterium RIFCSPLOWO2_01_FULL_39_24]
MRFKDRIQAGQLLADKLKGYADKDVVVYAIPRGGVLTAVEIARNLHAVLDLVITRKISHPDNPEYAIAATAENGHIVGTPRELALVGEDWLEREMKKGRLEVARRRKKYLHGKKMTSAKGKIAVVVDDGVATGLTLRVGIMEIKHYNPAKLIVAVPVVPRSTAKILRKEADELIALEIPSDDKFLGAVGSYYDSFAQVKDKDVIKILDAYR